MKQMMNVMHEYVLQCIAAIHNYTSGNTDNNAIDSVTPASITTRHKQHMYVSCFFVFTPHSSQKMWLCHMRILALVTLVQDKNKSHVKSGHKKDSSQHV